MRLINYNEKTGEFKSTVTESVSPEEIDLLRLIQSKKTMTWQELCDAMKLEADEDEGNRISRQIGVVHNLKDIGLVEETHIFKDSKLVDWAYTLSDTGKALLNIINQQKEK